MSAAHVMLSGAGMPTADGREALLAMGEKYRGRIACVATMIEGTGFWVSAFRGFLTSLQVMDRQPYRMKIFAVVPDLAMWLAHSHHAETGELCQPSRLESALNTLRARPELAHD